MQEGRLTDAAGAAKRHRLPGSHPQGESVEGRAVPAGVPDGQVRDHEGFADEKVGRRPGQRGWRLQDGGDRVGSGHAFGGGVVLGPDPTQRQVGLGREDQYEQAGAQVEAAVDQSQTDSDRDQRDRQRGQELQDERGQECQPQSSHGGASVGVGDVTDRRDLRGVAVERLEGWQSGDDVEEVVGQPGEGAELAAVRSGWSSRRVP